MKAIPPGHEAVLAAIEAASKCFDVEIPQEGTLLGTTAVKLPDSQSLPESSGFPVLAVPELEMASAAADPFAPAFH